MTFAAGIKEGGDTAILEMHEDGKPLAHLYLDAAELEGLIRDLAKIRATMADQVAPALDPGGRLDLERSPAWIADTRDGNAVLALRHPGMGWLGFLLEMEKAQAIGTALLSRSTPT
jgi:hypothetical protein